MDEEIDFLVLATYILNFKAKICYNVRSKTFHVQAFGIYLRPYGEGRGYDEEFLGNRYMT